MSPAGEPPVKRYPGVGQMVLLVIVAIGLQIATGATAFAIALVALGDVASATHQLRTAWVLVPVITFANCLTLALGLRGTRERARQFLRIRAFQPGLLPAVVLTCVGLPIVLSETDNCLMEMIEWMHGPELLLPDQLDLTASPVGALILFVVVAPLTEEYLFRGLILRGLLTHYSRTRAVIFSAVAFAVLHLNIRQGFLALIVGLVFGWWYTRTRSVGPGMVAHAIFNGFAWSAAQMPDVAEALGLFSRQDQVTHVPWWLAGDGLALTLFGLWYFHRSARVIGTDPSPPLPPMAEPPLLSAPPLLVQS